MTGPRIRRAGTPGHLAEASTDSQHRACEPPPHKEITAAKEVVVPFTPTNVKSADKRGEENRDIRPTHDQLYLADRVSDTAPKGRLSPAALQKLNSRYGVQAVTDALRCLRGFPPEVAVRSPYAYLVGIIEGSL